jgi:RNA polymerase sigma factor (sigma-70 family)
MTAASLDKVVAYVRRVAGPSSAAALSDGALLQHFLQEQDAGAFDALVQRHAGMVLGVCTRVLRHRQDAEDAVQATFMVLIRQGKSMISHANFAGWLHGVALRTSLYIRRRAARRRLVENLCSPPSAKGDPALDAIWKDLRLVLDDELGRLPAKYREPLVLCYLEGQTNEQAARILGWTKGTVSGRLARARDLLRVRLTRRGLTLSGAILVTTLFERGAPIASASLIQATVKTGVGVAAGTTAASSPVALTAQEVLHTMAISKLKLTLTIAGTLSLLLAGSGYHGRAMFNLVEQDQPPASQKAETTKQPPAEENPQVKEAMARTKSANNLKQLLLALHNFHDTYGRLPGVAITSTDGTPLLSWRVAILPFIEQDNLYRQFHLNEPWNSAHNRTLIGKIPMLYVRPGEAPKAPFKTYYRSFVGPDAFFSGHGGRKMPDSFPKGTSNALAIFEAGEGVVWTAPDEIPYSVERPLPPFGNWFTNGFHIGLMDGSVRMLPHKFDETIMRGLISVAEGQVVPIPDPNAAPRKK